MRTTASEAAAAPAASTDRDAVEGGPGGVTAKACEPIKILVAVHGIGDQLRCETVRAVAQRLGTDLSPALPRLPLGYFNCGTQSFELFQLYKPGGLSGDPRENIYFAEVYWADIPRQVVKAGDCLEDAKSWGRTVVSRAQALYQETSGIDDDEFQLAAGVVEEIVEGVAVLENLSFLAGKAGLFKFELGPLLRDFVGDVQLVADFPVHRQGIVRTFQSTLQKVHEAVDAMVGAAVPGDGAVLPAPRPREIYLIAHSEGTVVTYLGLLDGLQRHAQGAPADLAWVPCVKGLMTLGSPIDKHLVLWPEMWTRFGNIAAAGQRIRWRNYTDYGDPVGFKLDTARAWMQKRHITAFEFEDEHDHAFSRYLLPGKAHVDYWEDPAVFSHFLGEVVLQRPQVPAPGNRTLPRLLGPLLPYLLSLVAHVGGTYLLYKAVAYWGDADHVTGSWTFVNVVALALLLFGATWCARVPRLMQRTPRCALLSVMPYLLCWLPLLAAAWAAEPGTPPGPQRADFPLLQLVGELVQRRVAELPWKDAVVGAAVIIVVSMVPASTGWLAKRLPGRGRALLLGLGGAIAAALCVLTVFSQPLGGSSAPVWPIVLGGALFLYGWWLGVLTFDLSFLWHRYIRNSIAIDKLGRWARMKCEADARTGATAASPTTG